MPAATKYDQDLAIFSQLFDISRRAAPTRSAITGIGLKISCDRAVRLRSCLDGPDGMPGTADDFDAFLFSGNSGAGTPAKAGYPSIVVPGGCSRTSSTPPFPAGSTRRTGRPA